MRAMTVMKTSYDELTEEWGKEPVIFNRTQELFIRCNNKGEVNWDKAPVYTWPEIVEQKKKREVRFSSGPKSQWDI
jgi:hypothetical protein